MTKLIPVIAITLFVSLLVFWQFTDWSFISLLPYLLLGFSLTLASFSLSISKEKLLRTINWLFWCCALLLHLLLLIGSIEVRSVWEIIVFLGITNIFLYLFALTNRSNIFGKRTFLLAAVPAVTGVFFTLLFLIIECFLGVTFVCLIIGVLFALSGLLFGYRRTR